MRDSHGNSAGASTGMTSVVSHYAPMVVHTKHQFESKVSYVDCHDEGIQACKPSVRIEEIPEFVVERQKQEKDLAECFFDSLDKYNAVPQESPRNDRNDKKQPRPATFIYNLKRA